MGNFPKIISGINLHLTSCFIMNNNIRVGVGFLIPALAIIAFFASVLSENYLLGIFFAIAGVLVWFLYAAIMQSDLPDVAGNVIILFGFLLSAAVFLNYGLDQNMFGGLVFIPEGAIFSILLLFFSVLLGILFRNNSRSTLSSTALGRTPHLLIKILVLLVTAMTKSRTRRFRRLRVITMRILAPQLRRNIIQIIMTIIMKMAMNDFPALI